MRYVILGGQGQLGMELAATLQGSVWVARRDSVDITVTGWEADVAEYAPGAIFNCAAYNDVDGAQAGDIKAMEVNAWGVARVAKFCSDHKIRLVHFSTDQVFGIDGYHTPYASIDAPGPVNLYGLSKLAGEHLIRGACKDYVIIRTCGVYGLHGRGGKLNFVEKMLQRAAGLGTTQDVPLPVVIDQVCTPTYAHDLAVQAALMVERVDPGTYHVTNAGNANWFEFARSVFDIAGTVAELAPVHTEEYRKYNPGTAPRPKYSVLDNESARLKRYRLSELRHWKHALSAYFAERDRLPRRKATAGDEESALPLFRST